MTIAKIIISLTIIGLEDTDIIAESGRGGAVEANLRGRIHKGAIIGQLDALQTGIIQLVSCETFSTEVVCISAQASH